MSIPTAFPTRSASSVPTLTAAQMTQVGRLAATEFGIAELQIMEHAGSHLAELVRAELGGDLVGRQVVVAVGPGNGGGAGLAAARHLVNRGATVRAVLARPAARLTDPSRHQLEPLLQMAVDCCVALYDLPAEDLDRELAAADMVVDALMGFGTSSPPHDGVMWLLSRIARARARVISLDVPSGVNPDSGVAHGLAVHAAATLTLALPKPGLFRRDGPAMSGGVHLADIGLPGALYRRLGLEPGSPFVAGPIVRLQAET